MDYLENRGAVIGVIEDTAGTYSAPSASDYNVRMMHSGTPTVTLGLDVIGKNSDGSMLDGPVAVMEQQTIAFPELSFQVRPATNPATTDPVWFKWARVCGGKPAIINTKRAIVWDGVPSCNTMSAVMRSYTCDGKAKEWRGRGCRGNMTIGWEGANGPIMGKIDNLMGGFDGVVDLTAQTPVALTGHDATAPETSARYTFTDDGIVYVIPKFTFNAGITNTLSEAHNDSGVSHAVTTTQQIRINLTAKMLGTTDNTISTANGSIKTITLVGSGSAGFDILLEGCVALSPTIGSSDGRLVWEKEFTVGRFALVSK